MIYRVFADNNTIYDSRLSDLGMLQDTLELELNKAGSFNFTLPTSHPYRNSLKKLSSIVSVYRNNRILFRGRVLNSSYNFYNDVSFECEGELAFFNDSIQRPYDFQSGDKHTTVKDLFAFFVERHNAQVDAAKRFKVGKVTVTDSNNYIIAADSTYMNTWESINKKLIESYGGYLWVRHENDEIYIDYLADFAEVCSQPIKFGKNLLSLSKSLKGEEIITALIPLGAKDEETEQQLKIDAVADGKIKQMIKKSDFVYSPEAVKQYGWIFGSETWDNVTDAGNLASKAAELLRSKIAANDSIEFKAADLAGIDSTLSPFMPGMYLSVFSEPHNISASYLLKKMTLSITNPAVNSITIGDTLKSFTSSSANSIQNISYIRKSVVEIENNVTNVTKNYSLIKKEVQEMQGDYLSTAEANKRFKPYEDHISFDGKNIALSGKITQEPPKTPSLLNGWNNADGYAATSYWRDSCGVVHITGVISGGTATANTELFALPTGYRPASTEVFDNVSVDNNGSVKLKSDVSATYISFCGISFQAN